jgi:hypothetical protein
MRDFPSIQIDNRLIIGCYSQRGLGGQIGNDKRFAEEADFVGLDGCAMIVMPNPMGILTPASERDKEETGKGTTAEDEAEFIHVVSKGAKQLVNHIDGD